MVDELLGIEPQRSGQPGADRLCHPADHEVRRGRDAIILRHLQRVTDMPAGQHGEQSAGFGALAYQQRVGRLLAEQQPADTGVTGDGLHDIGHSCPSLFASRRDDHGRLGGRSQIGDHRIEDGAYEVVSVGEAFVEVAGGQPGSAADDTHSHRLIGTE